MTSRDQQVREYSFPSESVDLTVAKCQRRCNTDPRRRSKSDPPGQ